MIDAWRMNSKNGILLLAAATAVVVLMVIGVAAGDGGAAANKRQFRQYTRTLSENQRMYPVSEPQLRRLAKMWADMFDDDAGCEVFVAPLSEKEAAFTASLQCLHDTGTTGDTIQDCAAFVAVYLD